MEEWFKSGKNKMKTKNIARIVGGLLVISGAGKMCREYYSLHTGLPIPQELQEVINLDNELYIRRESLNNEPAIRPSMLLENNGALLRHYGEMQNEFQVAETRREKILGTEEMKKKYERTVTQNDQYINFHMDGFAVGLFMTLFGAAGAYYTIIPKSNGIPAL